MKILFDATTLAYFNDNSGYRAGIFMVAYNLLKEFKKLGHEIILYSHYQNYYFLKNIKELKEYKILEEHSLLNKIIAFLTYITAKNFPRKIIRLINIIIRFYNKYFYKITIKNLKQLEAFDVYFSPFDAPSPEIEQANLKRFRVVHDVIPIRESGLDKSNADWWKWHNRIYNTINDTDFYIANSEFTKKDILEVFPFINDSHITTALLGANEKFYINTNPIPLTYNIPKDKKYILSLCTLGKRKNIVFAINNFYKFIEKNKIEDTVLVLVGSIWKNFEKEFSAAISDYDTSKLVFTGYVKDEDLSLIYSNALFFIYPSLYEGFGLPVLEAMQCGCPVITSNVSSLPEVIGDCGIQINPKSNEDLISAYEKMYFDENFRKECSVKGLDRSKQFSWNKCANEIIEFIINTLSK